MPWTHFSAQQYLFFNFQWEKARNREVYNTCQQRDCQQQSNSPAVKQVFRNFFSIFASDKNSRTESSDAHIPEDRRELAECIDRTPENGETHPRGLCTIILPCQ